MVGPCQRQARPCAISFFSGVVRLAVRWRLMYIRSGGRPARTVPIRLARYFFNAAVQLTTTVIGALEAGST
jgi:hypothetical protein